MASDRLPLPDSHHHITAFGTYFGLAGYNAIAQQLYQRLLCLHNGFCDSPQFTRSLQLLRQVAALGVGKVGSCLSVDAVLVSNAVLVSLF